MIFKTKIVLTSIVFFAASAGFCADKNRYESGADREEGWIIRKTKEGIVKIPKKQFFSFEGLDVSGQAKAPAIIYQDLSFVD
jgi:hypothetical protein